MKHGQCARCVELAAEIARLTPYVEAFRREEARADKLGQELDDLRAAQGAPDSAEESTAVYLKGYAAGLNDGALTVRPAQCAPDTTHYLNAIRVRLETLYASAADDPRLREQLSDEVDWIDAQLSLSVTSTPAKGAPDWWIFEHQDGQRFFADKDIQHGKMAANAHWGENKWTRKPLFAGSAVTSTERGQP